MASNKKKNQTGVSEEMFVELNCEPFIEKISTKELEINKKYPIHSFRLVNTTYGSTLAGVLSVDGQQRMYFFPDHMKNKASALVTALQTTKEMQAPKDKHLVYLGKTTLDDDKEINNYIFTD